MLKGDKMLAPFCIDGIQEKLLFNAPHAVFTELPRLFSHHCIGGFLNTLKNNLVVDTLFVCPIHNRQIEAKTFNRLCLHGLRIPLVRIGFWGHKLINQIFNHLITHIFCNFRHVMALHDLKTLIEDHLALVIHYVIKLKQLLANIKVAAFNFSLRFLE